MTPDLVVAEALKLVDTPYSHQGRKPGVGIDCIGLPILVAKNLSLGDFDEIDYGRRPNGTLKRKIEQVCQPIVIQPGALLIFKIAVEAQHCGIVSEHHLEGFGLIHAWDVANKVVHQRLGDWRKKIVGCYGMPGVEYQ